MPPARPYIIMELVEGQPIDEYVRERAAALPLIVELMSQVCAAVHCAHQNLTVHADIKPANIQVRSDGTVKLLDFGIGRLLDGPEAGASLTESTRAAAAAAIHAEPLTRAYASPERCAGEPARPAGDIYSLGILLHQLLTGVVPTGPSLPDHDLAAIVARATALDPAARYGSALDLVSDLQRHLRRIPVVARRPTWSYVSGRFILRHRWAFCGAALLLLALLATAIVSTRLYLRAGAARAQADQRFAEAREMARFMLFDLHDELRRIPGTSATRLLLAQRGEQYLQRLAASPGAPADVRREVAVAYRKLGAVLGVPGEGTVGRTAEAVAALQSSGQLLEALRRATPTDDAVTLELARTRLIAARVHYMADSALAECARLNASGLALLDAVLQRQPDNAIARLWHWSARVYEAEGYVHQTHFEQALLRLRQLAAEAATMRDDPQFPDYRVRVEADIQRIMGDAYYYGERRSEALAHELWNVAYMQAELQQGAASLATTARAEALVEHVLDFGPDAWAEYVRACVRLQRAMALQSLGRHDEATSEFQRSYAWEMHNAEHDPGMANNLRSLAIVTRPMGLNYWQGGKRSEGCQWLQRSLGYWADLERRWGLTPVDADGVPEQRAEFAKQCPEWSPAGRG